MPSSRGAWSTLSASGVAKRGADEAARHAAAQLAVLDDAHVARRAVLRHHLALLPLAVPRALVVGAATRHLHAEASPGRPRSRPRRISLAALAILVHGVAAALSCRGRHLWGLCMR